MPLEAVMIVVDNSESSRNGDYPPTRYDAQTDAVNIIFQNVVQGNPESSVGLMSMAGRGPEVLVTLTTDQGKILEGLHRTKKNIRGSAHLSRAIQVAWVCDISSLSFPGSYRQLTSYSTYYSSHSSTDRTSPSGVVSSFLFARPSRKRKATSLSSPKR